LRVRAQITIRDSRVGQKSLGSDNDGVLQFGGLSDHPIAVCLLSWTHLDNEMPGITSHGFSESRLYLLINLEPESVTSIQMRRFLLCLCLGLFPFGHLSC
jgi:hypothetical protein